MLNHRIICRSIDELDEAAKLLIDYYKTPGLFAFYGKMGAGKTTFIKSICKILGVKENVTSPSFSVINEYKTNDLKSIFHFDFYRIKTETEAYDMGYEDYFFSNNFCLIEWPEKVEKLLPLNIRKIYIDEDNGNRIIRF